MNTWESSEDAFVQIGESWVRQSAVVIVEQTENGGSRIHLNNHKTILVNISPRKVIEMLVGREV